MYPVNELLNLIVCWTFIYQIYQGANKDLADYYHYH